MTDPRSKLGVLAAWAAALGLMVLVAALVLLRVERQRAIEEVSAEARERYAADAARTGRPDELTVLIALAADEGASLRDRNRAVWALGELRDELAIPALERLHVQEGCDHDRLVCQREVRKALAKIRGELSLRGSIRSAWRAARDRWRIATGHEGS